MRFILGALASAGMITGVSAQTPKPPEAPQPNAAAQRAAPGDLGMAIMSAQVSSDGVLLDGAGAVSAIRAAPGQYRVTFGRNVQTCTPSVTSSLFVEMSISAVKNGSDVAVYVYLDRIQQFYDTGFSIIVYCHR